MAKINYAEMGGEILIPRSYQRPLIAAIRNKIYRRACCVWHRRAGKDINVLANIVIPEACERIGNYYYYFPTLRLGKKAIWDAKTADERRFLDFFPKGTIKSINKSELMVTLFNDSIIQIIGLDNPDLAVRGTGPVGCVFSEYAEQPEEGWLTVSPVLLENNGWAIFIYTPKGTNHGQKLFNMAGKNKNWFCQHLTIEQTFRDAPGEDGLPVMTVEDVEEEIIQGKTREFCEQEYWCSFEGFMVGSIYGDLMREMQETDRIGNFSHNDSHRVYTAWDIGLNDNTAIVFFQYIKGDIRIIDFLQAKGKGLNYYLTELESGKRRRYLYEEHLAPWDFEHGSLAADGKSCMDLAREKGFRFRVVAKTTKISLDIEAVRQLLPRVCIDINVDCDVLIDSMKGYHREMDKKTGVPKKNPKHDKHSDACDAMRTLAKGFREPNPKTRKPGRAKTNHDVHAMYGSGRSGGRRRAKVKTGWPGANRRR